MEVSENKFSATESCPVRNIISRFSSKWGMLILLLLHEQSVLRFSEIQRYLSDISPKVLSATLHTLEEDGLIQREVYPTVPPKVEYSLTGLGQSLVPLLRQLAEWAVLHFDEILTRRSQTNARR
jgi:DNA-binding HxlR family transcriptional regulator